MSRAYDYMSRWVEKKVYSWNTDHWVLDKNLRFVYNGYLQIKELDALDSNAVMRKYIWEFDIAGSMTAADGVRALLSETNSEETFYELFDANGNNRRALRLFPIWKSHCSLWVKSE